MDALLTALQLHQWYALAALILTGTLQVFRKVPLTSGVWKKIPDGYRFLVPLFLGFATAFVGAWQEGQVWQSALLSALGGAIAIGFPSMGVAAALAESPIPWDGGAGGKPKSIPVEDAADDDKTPPSPRVPRVPPFAAVLCVGLLSAALFGGLSCSGSPPPIPAYCSGLDLTVRAFCSAALSGQETSENERLFCEAVQESQIPPRPLPATGGTGGVVTVAVPAVAAGLGGAGAGS